MKSFLLALAFLLLVLGLMSSILYLSVIWMAAFVSEERLGVRRFLPPAIMLPFLLYGIAAVACSLSHLKRRTRMTAYPLAILTGFTVWFFANLLAIEIIPDQQTIGESLLRFAQIGVPILLGIGVTALLKNRIGKIF